MKSITLGILTMLFAVLPLRSDASGSDWMSKVDGSRSLSQLSIPGTHDAGARYEPAPGTYKCQDLSLDSQLNAGVRFLDIRCRHVGNAFKIHHGPVYQKLTFDDVLKSAIGFLNRNPRECIIMSVKEEYNASGNTRSFEQTFDSYIAKNPGRWYLGANIPTLNQVRGKIVLFRRFDAISTPKGIDASKWPDNASFPIGENVKVQDEYQVSNDNAKWNAILRTLNEARQDKGDTLYVNFASGYQSDAHGNSNIPSVSNEINPKLTGYFAAHTHGRFGVVLMDFANPARCAPIYKTCIPHAR